MDQAETAGTPLHGAVDGAVDGGVDLATDERWMRRAIAVAESARGTTRPNPFVGAVVVADGVEIATGATAPVGGPHAEPRALAAAGTRARDATLYVTLEPCTHHGRTPPCTDAIVAAGVARVVIGMADTSPVAAGGADHLRARGLDVTTGVLGDRVLDQLEVFATVVAHGRPHVTCKLAQTIDGVTDPALLGGRWITGAQARARVHDLRAQVAGVLVGSTTALVDDPALTVRHAPAAATPPRPIVMDRRGRLPLDHDVVRPGAIVVTAPGSSTEWRTGLGSRGVDVVVVDSLAAGLAALVGRDVDAILAEPGPVLATALLEAGAVDRLLFHVADSKVSDPRPVEWALPVRGWTPVARRALGADAEWEFAPSTSIASPPAVADAAATVASSA